jgi:dTDP-4-amino-4,6-dideoxygalactose transaminase
LFKIHARYRSEVYMKKNNNLIVTDSNIGEGTEIWHFCNIYATALHCPNLLPLLDCYKSLNYSASDFPVGSRNAKMILSLPMFPELTNTEVNYVCDKIKSLYS